MNIARPQAKHRCTVQQYASAGEDAYYIPRRASSATNYILAMPCLWWQEIGTGELLETNRDAIINLSRMIAFPASGYVLDTNMTIANIRDRLGNVLDAGIWNIQSITHRHSQGGYLLLLERVT